MGIASPTDSASRKLKRLTCACDHRAKLSKWIPQNESIFDMIIVILQTEEVHYFTRESIECNSLYQSNYIILYLYNIMKLWVFSNRYVIIIAIGYYWILVDSLQNAWPVSRPLSKSSLTANSCKSSSPALLGFQWTLRFPMDFPQEMRICWWIW